MERITRQDVPADMYRVMMQVEHYLENSGLDKKLMELMRMRVSQINSCAYCLDMHYKEGIAAGETPLRLISVSAWRETPYYSPKEQAVLEFAEVLTRLPEEKHSEGIHDQLSKYFSKAEIANLTLAIAQINTWNRITRSFGTVPGNYTVPARREAVVSGHD